MSRRKSKPVHNIGFEASIASSQKNQGIASLVSHSNLTTDQEPSSSSQSSATATKESYAQDDSKEHIPTDASALVNLYNVSAPGSLVRNGDRQTGAQCQTHKVDSTSALRPKDPAEAFKALSPDICRPNYLANRRSVPFIIHDETYQVKATAKLLDRRDTKTSSRDHETAEMAIQSLKRSSLVKLSMNLDGNAQVAPRTGDTPSPPHPKPVILAHSKQRSRSGLQRSLSAVECSTLGNAHDFAASYFTRRPLLGRSRDARTWEFYCDSDTRDALNKQAQREEDGSATAPIGLIRSRSGTRNSLTPNPNKRNAHVSKNDAAKRYKVNKDVPTKLKLGRTISSVARLQTTSASNRNQKPAKTATKHGKSNSQSAIFEDPNGDSDKENWEPGTHTRRPLRRRPVTSEESARILLESLHEPSESSSFELSTDRQGSKSRQGPSAPDDKENQSPLIDGESTASMGEPSLLRVEEDLDCVQNLLKLKEAAWI